ncbi:hypothetical protein [Methylobacterium sp. 1030]|uniref:hypothetical protein n=1 Tax=Methylobacterium sp. 1030 TaxID=3156404 RepID=UPI003393F473
MPDNLIVGRELAATLAQDNLRARAALPSRTPRERFFRDRMASDAAAFAAYAAGLVDFEGMEARMFRDECILMDRHRVIP